MANQVWDMWDLCVCRGGGIGEGGERNCAFVAVRRQVTHTASPNWSNGI